MTPSPYHMSAVEVFMITCEDRQDVRNATLASLRASDFGTRHIAVLSDWSPSWVGRLERIYRQHVRMLRKASRSPADAVLMLEDDLAFPMDFGSLTDELVASAEGQEHFWATLYIPPGLAVTNPRTYWGGQAVLTRPATIRYCLDNWAEEPASLHADLTFPRLASKVCPLVAVSVVQHTGVSTWGGPAHEAVA